MLHPLYIAKAVAFADYKPSNASICASANSAGNSSVSTSATSKFSIVIFMITLVCSKSL